MENIKNNSKKKYVLCLIGDKENIRDTDQILFAKTIQSSTNKTLKLLNLESTEMLKIDLLMRNTTQSNL